MGRHSRCTGTSLIEVVIGVAIFALASVPVIGLFGRGAVFTQANSDQLAAMHRASSYLRSLLSLPYRDVPLGRPVTLNRTFGSDSENQIHIPASETIDGNTFRYRLWIDYVKRDESTSDFFFRVKPSAGMPAAVTSYRKLLRLEFEVSWESKMTQKTETVRLFLYKGDLG